MVAQDKKTIMILKVIFCILSVFFIIRGFLEIEDWYPFSGPEQIILGYFFSLLFFIVSIDEFINGVFNFFLFKLALTIVFTSLAYISIAEASNLLNQIYHIDSAWLPFSRIFISGIFFFKKISYPILSVGLIFLVFVYLYDMLKDLPSLIKTYKENYDYKVFLNIFLNWSFLFLITTIICSVFIYKFNYKYFSNDVIARKVPLVARVLDFYDNTICELDKDYMNSKILYIDSNNEYILIDKSEYYQEQPSLWDILNYEPEELAKIYNWIAPIPAEKIEYKILRCKKRELIKSEPVIQSK